MTSLATIGAYQISPRRGMSYRTKVEGRLEAAKINGGAAAATPRGNDRYTVVGREGARYTVMVFNIETMACDCRAGRNGGGTPCWHAAAVYLRLVADRARGIE